MTIDYTQSNAQGKENKIVNLGLTKLPFPAITGLTLAADVHIKHPNIATELTFNTVDADDIVWVITDIQNWWNMPEPEIPDIARGLDDGSYDVRGRWRAKNVTLTGSILVPNASKAPAARQKIMEYFDLVYQGGWLIVDEPTYRKASYVRLAGQPTFENINPRGRINFTIPLRAGDPLKYYWDRNDANGYTYANTITSNVITNTGNYQVAGVFNLVGPIDAPASITAVDTNSNTTQTLRITTSLRDTTYTTGVTYAEFSGGTAIITANAVANSTHGFLVGDKITVASVGSRYNISNATVTGITTSTISYEKPIANIVSISHTGNIATALADAAHGLAVGDSVFIKNNGNPVFDGAYTVKTAGAVPTTVSLATNVVTVNTSTPHYLVNGDSVDVTITSSSLSIDATYTVTVVDSDTFTFAYTHADVSVESVSSGSISSTRDRLFTFDKTAANQATGYGGILSPQITNAAVSPAGSVTLSVVDTMQIDTYNNTVVYRGLPDESRSTLAVNVDWIKIKPGNTALTFSKISGAGTCSLKYRSGWIG